MMVPILEAIAANHVYERAMTVGCPACCADPGKPCVDWNDSADPSHWTARNEPHPGRVEAAQFVASVDAGLGGGQVHEATTAEIDTAAEDLV